MSELHGSYLIRILDEHNLKKNHVDDYKISDVCKGCLMPLTTDCMCKINHPFVDWRDPPLGDYDLTQYNAFCSNKTFERRPSGWINVQQRGTAFDEAISRSWSDESQDYQPESPRYLNEIEDQPAQLRPIEKQENLKRIPARRLATSKKEEEDFGGIYYTTPKTFSETFGTNSAEQPNESQVADHEHNKVWEVTRKSHNFTKGYSSVSFRAFLSGKGQTAKDLITNITADMVAKYGYVAQSEFVYSLYAFSQRFSTPCVLVVFKMFLRELELLQPGVVKYFTEKRKPNDRYHPPTEKAPFTDSSVLSGGKFPSSKSSPESSIEDQKTLHKTSSDFKFDFNALSPNPTFDFGVTPTILKPTQPFVFGAKTEFVEKVKPVINPVSVSTTTTCSTTDVARTTKTSTTHTVGGFKLNKSDDLDWIVSKTGCDLAQASIAYKEMHGVKERAVAFINQQKLILEQEQALVEHTGCTQLAARQALIARGGSVVEAESLIQKSKLKPQKPKLQPKEEREQRRDASEELQRLIKAKANLPPLPILPPLPPIPLVTKPDTRDKVTLAFTQLMSVTGCGKAQAEQLMFLANGDVAKAIREYNRLSNKLVDSSSTDNTDSDSSSSSSDDDSDGNPPNPAVVSILKNTLVDQNSNDPELVKPVDFSYYSKTFQAINLQFPKTPLQVWSVINRFLNVPWMFIYLLCSILWRIDYYLIAPIIDWLFPLEGALQVTYAWLWRFVGYKDVYVPTYFGLLISLIGTIVTFYMVGRIIYLTYCSLGNLCSTDVLLKTSVTFGDILPESDLDVRPEIHKQGEKKYRASICEVTIRKLYWNSSDPKAVGFMFGIVETKIYPSLSMIENMSSLKYFSADGELSSLKCAMDLAIKQLPSINVNKANLLQQVFVHAHTKTLALHLLAKVRETLYEDVFATPC
jgi:hypothetical protein